MLCTSRIEHRSQLCVLEHWQPAWLSTSGNVTSAMVCTGHTKLPCREHTEDTEYAKILAREAFSAVLYPHSFSPPFFLSLSLLLSKHKNMSGTSDFIIAKVTGRFGTCSLISEAVSNLFHLCTNSCSLEVNFNYM